MRDDRERLERGRRERGLRRQQVGFYHVAGERRRCEAITACDFAQNDAAFAILGLDVLQHRRDLTLFGAAAALASCAIESASLATKSSASTGRCNRRIASSRSLIPPPSASERAECRRRLPAARSRCRRRRTNSRIAKKRHHDDVARHPELVAEVREICFARISDSASQCNPSSRSAKRAPARSNASRDAPARAS